MAISETVSSVDTHELMPTDFYPLPSEGALMTMLCISAVHLLLSLFL